MANSETHRLTAGSRHERDCKICAHPEREAIETAFVEWVPQPVIAREFGIPRTSVWRHARALRLFERRDANLKTALRRFIEAGSATKPTPSSFVAAVVALSRLDDLGRDVSRIEHTDSRDNGNLFARMTNAERLRYAESGELPAWWPN